MLDKTFIMHTLDIIQAYKFQLQYYIILPMYFRKADTSKIVLSTVLVQDHF